MIRNIQALRAFAALLVVWAHLKEFFPESPLVKMLPSGISGVDLFFVISGFIMVSSTANPNVDWRSFFEKRVVRILPLYYFFTFLVLALTFAAPAAFKSSAPSWQQLWQSLAFIPFEKAPGRIYPLYYLGWTLNFEMFFYAIFAASLALGWSRRALTVGLAIVFLVVLGTVLPNLDGFSIPAYFFTRPIMLDFLFGVAIGAAVERSPKNALSPSAGFLILVLGCIGFFGAVYVLPQSAADQLYAPTMHTVLRYGIWAGLIVFAAVDLERNGYSVANRLALRIGDASYSLYLSHFLIVGAAISVANRLHLDTFGRIAAAGVTLALCCLAAVLCHRWIETPLSGLLRSAFGLLRAEDPRLVARAKR
ncbi:acyltransferase [Bradyrhizobium diazoefficiens]|nr:acyltransferase [Bradyrhizobium diazoefficiens]MBR0851333.1 acyltransferase [Bradyrhizobium diazoefficiens]